MARTIQTARKGTEQKAPKKPRTSTIQATINSSAAGFKKQKKARTSTIQATLDSSAAGFKKQRKPTKTRTMVETIKDAQPKVAAKPKRAPKAKKAGKKTKKVAKAKK